MTYPGRIGRLVLVPALPDFLARYPAIDIELGVTDRAVDLIAENVDCALRVGPLADTGMIARSVGMLDLVNVASPAYLARYGVPHSPDDLSSHMAVRYASPSSGRIESWEWLDAGVPRTVMVGGRVAVNSAEAYIACALAGLGLIQVPAYDVRAHLAAGDLIEVLPDHRAESMPMTMLYPHRHHLSQRLQVFVDWLTNVLAKATTR